MSVERMPGLLVDAAWLADHLSDVQVAHVGWEPAEPGAARAAFESAHIPGAVFLDVDTDLAGRPFVEGPGRHPLPSPGRFAETMALAGISDGSRVVVYDDARGSLAARLWWMLDVTGHDAAVLDGGFEAWEGEREKGSVSARTRGSFTPRPWPPIADAEAVAAAVRDSSSVVLDSRAGERFRGEVEPFDPVAGHIPGARSAEWSGNLDARGRFLAPAALRERFTALGAPAGTPTIAHCGSGVTACHTVLALRLAGYTDALLYEGSWSDWVSDRSRPVAVGDA